MSPATARTRRHRAIRDLVSRRALGSQDELARALEGEGHGVTQSTLSRDLRELRIVRVPTDDGYRYVPQDEAAGASEEIETRQLRRVATLEVTGVEANEMLVIVRTLVGRAQGVAVTIDAWRLPDVLGTVAGDDTILVVPRSVRKTRRLERELAALLGTG